jgi:hypothetical protein
MRRPLARPFPAHEIPAGRGDLLRGILQVEGGRVHARGFFQKLSVILTGCGQKQCHQNAGHGPVFFSAAIQSKVAGIHPPDLKQS